MASHRLPSWRDLPVVLLGWVEFDGTEFSGFQYQPGRRTVQGVLQATLRSFFPQSFRLFGSSRTDAGVHAKRMGISLHLPAIPPWPVPTLTRAWQARLPRDLWLHDLVIVSPPFHARYSAQAKRYRYRILQHPSPLRERYAWFFPRRLNKHRIYESLNGLPSRVDLRFFHAGPPVKRTDTDGFSIRVLERADEIHIVVQARRFLYRSVRLLVGALLHVGEGRVSPQDFREALEGKKPIRPYAVPAHGLTLERVFYPPLKEFCTFTNSTIDSPTSHL